MSIRSVYRCIFAEKIYSATVISYRKYKSIDMKVFLADLLIFSLILDPPDVVDKFVDLDNSTLRDIMYQHASLRTTEMAKRPMLPWSNKNIQATKKYRMYW